MERTEARSASMVAVVVVVREGRRVLIGGSVGRPLAGSRSRSYEDWGR